MNDIIIQGKIVKRELKILLACWALANLVNFYAIIKYETNWVEVITFQPMVLLITATFYLATWVARWLYKLTLLIVRRVRH